MMLKTTTITREIPVRDEIYMLPDLEVEFSNISEMREEMIKG